MSALGVDQIEEMGGTFDFTLKFDDDTVSMTVTSTVPASDSNAEMDMEVAYEGSYSVSGDKIKITDWTGTSKVNGEEQSADATDLGMSDGESEYSCSGDTLTVDGEDYAKK